MWPSTHHTAPPTLPPSLRPLTRPRLALPPAAHHPPTHPRDGVRWSAQRAWGAGVGLAELGAGPLLRPDLGASGTNHPAAPTALTRAPTKPPLP